MKRPMAGLGSALLLGIVAAFAISSRFSMTGCAVLDRLAASLPEQDGRVALSGTVAELREKAWGWEAVLSGLSVAQPEEGGSGMGRVAFDARVRFYEDAAEQAALLLPGDRAAVVLEPDACRPASNDGGFDSGMTDLAKGIGLSGSGSLVEASRPSVSPRRWFHQANLRLSEQMEKILPPETAGPLMTMLLGNSELLDEAVRLGYQASGLSHLLAISGLHVALLGFGVYRMLQLATGKEKGPAAAAIVFTWLFCLLTYAHTSTVRASIMLTVQLSTRFNRRRYDGRSALYMTFAAMLLWQPWQLFGIGFQLSFLAVAGILHLYRPLAQRWDKPWLKPLAMLVSVNLATFPVLAETFHQFPPYSFLANLLVVPFMGLVVGIGSAAVGLSFVHLEAGRFLAGSCHAILSAINGLNGIIQALPFSSLSTGTMDWIRWTLLFGAAYFLFAGNRDGRVSLAVLAGAAAVLLASGLWQQGVLRVSMLDVGQGDALAIHYSGRTWLVDGGGWMGREGSNTGRNVLLPYLRANGVNALEGVFVTHADFDHVYGVIELLSYMPCKTVYLPAAYEKVQAEGLLASLLEASSAAGAQVAYLKAGEVWRFRRLAVECLSSGLPGGSGNDQSLVLSLGFGDFDMLLAGDAEEPIEEKLAASGKLRPVEVLKTGHHGSSTSSSEAFIAALSPETALISVGEGNRFGHPSPEVVERLENHGVRIAMTKDAGQIDIWTAGFGGKYLCAN